MVDLSRLKEMTQAELDALPMSEMTLEELEAVHAEAGRRLREFMGEERFEVWQRFLGSLADLSLEGGDDEAE